VDPIGKNLAPIVNEAARNLATARQLVASDGTVLCWNCVDIQRRTPEVECQAATFPTLHCADCIERYRQKREKTNPYVKRVVHGITYEHPVESDHDYQWGRMIHNMKHGQSIDQESAARMLANAKALPGAFEGDTRELEAAYVARFGHYNSKPNKSVRYRDQKGAAE
jgi:hypothetical protein